MRIMNIIVISPAIPPVLDAAPVKAEGDDTPVIDGAVPTLPFAEVVGCKIPNVPLLPGVIGFCRMPPIGKQSLFAIADSPIISETQT